MNRSNNRRNRSNNRRNRSNNRRRTSIQRTIRSRGRTYTINIPDPQDCLLSRRRRPSGVYCGKKSRLPPGYSRRGGQYDCLKKGFGAGRCSIYRS
jgi:hypothetical protein